MAEDSTSKAIDLEAVARSRFGELSEAERRLMRAVPKGEFAHCGPSKSDSDPANDPAKANGWGAERWIRAELVCWLCRESEARKMVHAKGLQVHAAKVVGKLDLSFATVTSPLIFFQCQFTDSADLMYASIPVLNLTGSWTRGILADGANIPGGIFLRRAYFAEGEVRMLGVRVGNLDCDGGRFENPSGVAISADGTEITGNLRFCDHFSASGQVRLLGARIRDDLDCSGGTFNNPGDVALAADRASVGGSAFMNETFCADGEVRLIGAKIGNNLDCADGTFKNSSGSALHLDGVNVSGNILFRGKFSAEGQVRLIGAQVKGNVECDQGTFRNPGRVAVNAENVDIEGHVFLRDRFSAEGQVVLFGAHIGGSLSCQRGAFGTLHLGTAVVKGIFLWSNVRIASTTMVELKNASVGSIEDEEASWPERGKLALL